ncbi:hypothetical protein CC78DRAFT_540697 [Lojkania enalia]|uniref:NYN domain-containing protein n=1 Tax=Lojkania enalia TaxID=147567 RepID=A0A9P4KGZ3_9PLEO|nr:hypothetical protein CC78DRAFT_540697 [Didymosphaeria enalia]
MPSQPVDTPWDFGPVLSQLNAELYGLDSPTSLPDIGPAVQVRHDIQCEDDSHLATSLGSFHKLWYYLGVPADLPPPIISPIEPEELSSSDEALLSSPPNSGNASQSADPYESETLLVPRANQPKKSDASNAFASLSITKDEKKERKLAREATQRAEIEKKKKERHGKKLEKETKIAQQDRRLELLPPKSAANLHTFDLKPRQVAEQPLPDTGIKVTSSAPTPIQRSSTPVAMSHLPKSPEPNIATSCARYHAKQLSSNDVSTCNPEFSTASSALTALNSSLTKQYTLFGMPFPSQRPPLTNPLLNSGAGVFTNAPMSSRFTPPIVYQANFPSDGAMELVPRTAQSAIVRTSGPRTPAPTALALRPQDERHFCFLQQLMHNFPEDQSWLLSPMQMLNTKTSAGGVHIFIDASNILLGFRDRLKDACTQMFDLSFDCLALLLERRRPVSRRVLAGSSRESAPLAFVDSFIAKAEVVGYENNVYEQVYKRKELTGKQKFFKNVERIGWTRAIRRRSGSDSDSEMDIATSTTSTPPTPKWVEQGVDENLHLKMCQSLLDYDSPATMVLATGDGAAAEYSDGFLAHVERALKRGWHVELVSWKQQINRAYTKKKFQMKWMGNFKIIYLDDYLESLIDT